MKTGSEPIKTRESDSEEDVLEEARDRAAYAHTQWRDNFAASEAELQFLYGDQWDDKVIAQRDAQDMPSLTINNLPTHIDQVLGDQRMARPQISIHPADDADYDIRPEPDNDAERENPGAVEPIKFSKVFEGLIRNIEYTSSAEMHYDQAFQHAIEGGFGWLRVVTDYADDQSFDQDVRIQYVRDRYSVLIDPDCKEPDYSDAMYAFIAEMMPMKEFRKRYPGAEVGPLTEGMDWWGDQDHVTVTEYFRREPMTRVLLQMSDGKTHFKDEIESVLDEMQDNGVTVVRERKVKTFKVLWSKITAHSVLEKARPWAGRTIPLVPVLGKYVDTREGPRYRGLTRYAKDAKRMHNLMMSSAIQRISMSPKAPWIGTLAMFEGFEDLWENANRESRAYLPYNPDPDAPGGRPDRSDFAAMPAAELQAALGMGDMVKATIGQFDASLGAQSNETSGKAIMARQREGDVASYAFVDNLNRAIAKVGRILVEIIPKIYDTERIVRVRHLDDSTQLVRINRTMVDEETGKEVLVADIATGRFDVVVKSGPSHTTQRMEAVEAMMQFVQAAPSIAPAILDELAKNMDWPGADKIAERLRKMVPRGLLTQREAANLPEQEPTPEQQAEMAKANAEMASAKAEEARAAADTAMAEAKSLEAQAKLAEIKAMADGGNVDAQAIEEIVIRAVARIEGEKQQMEATHAAE